MSEVISWRTVEPLPPINGDLDAMLATIDVLKGIWEEAVGALPPERFAETRRQTLTKHAIETGIIERLYNLDWGVTEALVAEGLTAEVAQREGGVDENTLAVIRDQYEALTFLTDSVREEAPLTLHFIRQLHQLITRHQATYDAHDQLGRPMRASLPHGSWKTVANHVRRSDGSTLEYVPPEHVQSQMELLLAEFDKTAAAHPIVRAAWLHHRFILIHPFADGNGRVARALTLLVLLAARYAPLVVDRRQRPDYIAALDQANLGDLRPLVRFFARLEGAALAAEFTRPVEQVPAQAGAVAVAQAHAARLREPAEIAHADRVARAAAVAAAAHERLVRLLERRADELREAFLVADPRARASVKSAAPPEPAAAYWRHQLIQAARAVGFYTNLSGGAWWVRLNLAVLGQRLRYLTAVQKLGRDDRGVLVVTCWAELFDPAEQPVGGDNPPLPPRPALDLTPDDGVLLLYTSDVEGQWPAIADFVERTLAAAVNELGRQLA